MFRYCTEKNKQTHTINKDIHFAVSAAFDAMTPCNEFCTNLTPQIYMNDQETSNPSVCENMA